MIIASSRRAFDRRHWPHLTSVLGGLLGYAIPSMYVRHGNDWWPDPSGLRQG
jgi:hypothetical protein